VEKPKTIAVPSGVRQEIEALVSKFRDRQKSYDSGYQEESVRAEFINPFFKALGWDVENKANLPETLKPVVHIYSQRLARTTVRPDYAFRYGREKKFLLEAKKPAVDIFVEKKPAYQARIYSFNEKLPIAILTNFKQFAVYDYRITKERPSPEDKPEKGRREFFTFEQYLDNLEFLYSTFSYEAAKQLNFDLYVEEAPTKILREVDEDFLLNLESWRKTLAQDIARKNLKLSPRELNFAVQVTIDRIIFLRMAEDRGIEQPNQLQSLINGTNVYPRLLQVFYRCDDKYNSGLFDFKNDQISTKLKVDDKVLAKIIDSLYGEDCPYLFSQWDADVLGSVYERFLGKVIHLTATHQARVEDKPEVKKAKGVYYTPKYIVEYIVKNTVDKRIEGKAPKEISQVKILDPACGSGSFLVQAYQHLLNYHLEWYAKNDPAKNEREGKILRGPDNATLLTIKEKKKILLNNIFGVDIDPQAVEVTKLSLLLKVLEDEDQESIAFQQKLWRERSLPDLDNNIKCGNSLIENDFYKNRQMNFFDDEAKRKINAFDWEAEFPEVFRREEADKSVCSPGAGTRGAGTPACEQTSDKSSCSPGFDVVIGNPPYVRQETLGEQKQYFETHYQVYHGMADLYAYFIEKAMSLLKPGGYFSFIVSNKWMRANYAVPLRAWLKKQRIISIVDFGDLPVFTGATTYPCILVMSKGKPLEQIKVCKAKELESANLPDYIDRNCFFIKTDSLGQDSWSLSDSKSQNLLDKIKAKGIPLSQYVQGKIFRGILTGLNEAFVIDKATRNRLIKEDKNSAEIIKPFLLGRDIKRYQEPVSTRYLIFTRRGIDIKKYPAIEKHLLQFKDQLMPKPPNWKGDNWKGRKPGNYKWYEIQDTIDYHQEFEKPKIIFPDISTRGNFAYDGTKCYTVNTSYIIPVDDLFLLGVLNSSLITFFYKSITSSIRGDYLRFIYQYVATIPIAQAQKSSRDPIASLVNNMLSLHKKLSSSKTPDEKVRLEREIKATDQEIDRLVYELYGLIDEEIKIIEGIR